VRPDIHQEQFEIRAEGEGGRVALDVPWLQAKPAPEPPARAAEVPGAEPPPSEPVDGESTPLGATGGEPLVLQAVLPQAVLPQAVDGEGEFPILPGSEEREEG
jgi:hypothetical protein